jgi:serine protease DegQ
MRNRVSRSAAIVLLLVCMCALTGTAAVAQKAASGGKFRSAIARALDPSGSYAPMLEKVIPAVVTLRVSGEKLRPVVVPVRLKDGTSPPLPKGEVEEFGAGGSGVIVDPKRGYILTNNHVIEQATNIDVGLYNGRRVTAKLIGTDIGTDIAVIKVDEADLPSIKLGDSDAVRVGDIVAAVGNPFGLEGTATLGMISAVRRTEIGHGAFEDFLQTDAQINPGNSGGALVNFRGELIGINTVAGGGRGRGVGLGFAVPINMAKVVMDELILAGRMRRGSIGLIVEDLPMAMASPPEGGAVRGAIVRKVLPKSPAAAAGIEPGDIVVSAGNKPVRTAGEFVTRTVTVPLGSTIDLIIFTKGHGRIVSVTLADIVFEPEETTLGPDLGNLAGAVVGEILIGNRLYGEMVGAQVLKIAAKSPAYWVGLEPEDVIVGIDDAKVRSPAELLYRVRRAGKDFAVSIVRNGSPGLIRATR